MLTAEQGLIPGVHNPQCQGKQIGHMGKADISTKL